MSDKIKTKNVKNEDGSIDICIDFGITIIKIVTVWPLGVDDNNTPITTSVAYVLAEMLENGLKLNDCRCHCSKPGTWHDQGCPMRDGG